MIKFTLDKVMKAKDYSIQDIAKLTGLSRTTISNMVNNNAKGIQLETLEKLADVLNADITDIIDYYPSSKMEEIKIKITNLTRENDEEYKYEEIKGPSRYESILPINITLEKNSSTMNRISPMMSINFNWNIEVGRDIQNNVIEYVNIRVPSDYKEAFQYISLKEYLIGRITNELTKFILQEISTIDTSELADEESLVVQFEYQ